MKLTDLMTNSVAVNPLSVLDRIIASLELTQKQYEDATRSYEAVAAVLTKIHPGLQPSIFPHGSMRAGTTIRPIRNEHFDLDMICWLYISGQHFTPDQVYNIVWEALGQDATYRAMRKKKSRCIRLEHPTECKFHLDVVPAIPDWAASKSLYIPDRERKVWHSSHPIAYCDDWFKKISETMPIIRPVKSARNRLNESVIMCNAAYVDPMPEHGAFTKTPLQRIVQLLKRDRDVHFQDDSDHRPASIVLSTLTAHSYSSLVTVPFETLLEFVVAVVVKLPEFITVAGVPGAQKYLVNNPVNPQENFTEVWSEEHYKRFCRWHARIASGLQNVRNSKGLGNDVLLNRLSENFGKDDVIKAAGALGADTSALHEAGKLNAAVGAVGVVGAKIPKTIYFGSAK